MPERVLITGARAPAALNIARSFASAGFEVHMADCVPSRMSGWSRASARIHRYPAPRSHPTAFKEAVTQLASALEPALIIPACEEVFHLAAIDAITPRLFAPSLTTLRRLHSKYLFAEDCARLGLPAPVTTRVTTQCELDAFRGASVSTVFKPEYSRFGSQTLVGPSPSALDSLQPSAASPWVAQPRIRGAEISLYAASVSSRLVAFSAYGSPWRFKGGAGYAFEPIEPALHARLRDIADAIARHLAPFGQFACDVIVDEAGEPWLIECNPRATSGAFLFRRSPDLALALLGRLNGPALGITTESIHVAPALWLEGLPHALRHGRFKEWMNQRHSGNDAIGAPGDRAPVLGALADTLLFGGKALASGKSLAEEMTADIEWNGEEL